MYVALLRSLDSSVEMSQLYVRVLEPTSTIHDEQSSRVVRSPDSPGLALLAVVIDRMAADGTYVDDAVLGPIFKASDGEWYPLKLADMSHTTDVVNWWNSTGRAFGAKAPEVRTWMLDSNNYI